MSQQFIPTVWSARLLVLLQKALVYGQSGVVNRDYEGEIADKGDTVKISSVGDVTVSDYTADIDMNSPEALSDAEQILSIDQGKYFNFQIDDVKKKQTAIDYMDQAMMRAAYSLRDKSDQFIASSYVNVPSGNLIGSDASAIALTTASNAYEYLVDLGTKLTEANIPTDGRFVTLPPWVHGLLQKDDRFVKFGTPSQTDILFNGKVGRAAGFDILESNNVPNTSGALYKIIAGHPMAYSYAEQISKMETFRMEKRFATGVKGLHVYGGRLVRPTAWAVLTASKS